MSDMLVNLYDLHMNAKAEELLSKGISIKQALVLDKSEILQFVSDSFEAKRWIWECEAAILHNPSSCFIAVCNEEIVGFVCYDATAKGMLGPLGVRQDFRGLGIATELLLTCFTAMRYAGYAYAIIGWVNSEEFYTKVCGAIPIPDSDPGVYSRLISK